MYKPGVSQASAVGSPISQGLRKAGDPPSTTYQLCMG